MRCSALVQGLSSSGDSPRLPPGPAHAVLCRVLLHQSKLPFCPALQQFGPSSSLLKLIPATSTMQLSGACISYYAVLSSGYFPTQAWICSRCEFPHSRPTVTLAAARWASLPLPHAASKQCVTFHFSSRGSRNIHILNYRYFSQIAYLCSVFIIVLHCFAID